MCSLDTLDCPNWLQPRMTMARTLKLYKLLDVPATPGLRPMTAADVPQVRSPPFSGSYCGGALSMFQFIRHPLLCEAGPIPSSHQAALTNPRSSTYIPCHNWQCVPPASFGNPPKVSWCLFR